MKKTPKLTEIYVIESPEELEESKCPKCGDPDAYISFNNDVDCPNAKCSNHKGNTDPLGKKGKGGGGQAKQAATPKGWPGYPQGYSPAQDYFDHPGQGPWTSYVDSQVAKVCGPRWKDDVDKHQGRQGAADNLLENLWILGYGPKHAVEEAGFYWDLATGGLYGTGTTTPLTGHYQRKQIGSPDRMQPAYDFVRDAYPAGVNKRWPGDPKNVDSMSPNGQLDASDIIWRPRRK